MRQGPEVLSAKLPREQRSEAGISRSFSGGYRLLFQKENKITLGRCVFLVKQLLRYFWTITRGLACEYVSMITVHREEAVRCCARLLISVHAFLHP